MIVCKFGWDMCLRSRACKAVKYSGGAPAIMAGRPPCPDPLCRNRTTLLHPDRRLAAGLGLWAAQRVRHAPRRADTAAVEGA